MERALVKGLSAFVAVFVVGTGLVYALHAIAGGSAAPSPSHPKKHPTRTPTPPPEPTTPDAYLAWVPGGLPEGFGDAVSTLDDVGPTTVATADNIWMRRSFDRTGAIVDQPTPSFMIPIDTTGVDPRGFAPFLSPTARRQVASLANGEGILSETSSTLRRIGIGGELEFRTRASVRIVGVLPDVQMGGYELLVNRATGAQIGIDHERYVIFRANKKQEPTSDALRTEMEELLPADAPYQVVEVRAPGETTFLRMSDLILPPLLIKARFGEFAAYPNPADPGTLVIDPAWVRKNIETATVPLLGTITCHKKIVFLVRRAMTELVREGASDVVQTYSGCYAPRNTLGEPDASISHHAWGVAIDINAPTNPFGQTPDQDPRLVEAMERWGFVWGGDFIVPDGHHFEYLRPPTRTG